MGEINRRYYELKKMAKELEEKGICKVYACGEFPCEVRFAIDDWNIQTGEDFIKASALVHIIDEWAECAENGSNYIAYAVEDDYTATMYIIEVYCVWL